MIVSLRRPRLRSSIHLCAALVGLCASAGIARAQDRTVDAELFKPALDPYGLFMLDRPQTSQQWELGFKAAATYAINPLYLDMATVSGSPATAQPVVSRSFVTDLQLDLGLTDWLELAFDAPFTNQALTSAYGVYGGGPAQNGVRTSTGFYAQDPPTNVVAPDTGPMDTRLALKASAYHHRGLSLGAALIGTLPFGDTRTFTSSGPTLQPKLLADQLIGERLDVVVDLGASFRHQTTVYDPWQTSGTPSRILSVGNEWIAGAGVSYRATRHIGAGVEADMLGGLGVPGDVTGEALAGLLIIPSLDDNLAIAIGGGHSIVPSAARRDDGRVFLTLAWAPSEGRGPVSMGDRDGDGIPDDKDLCPDEPEDKDGFEDADGCPDNDNDNDGIPDASDKCPNEPEDKDGFEDADGCPDVDNDGDGVPDDRDKCPNQPEDRDGFEDADGCPDPDNDGDGIPDNKDQCPNEPETMNGYEDEDGCPDSVGAGVTATGPVLTQGKVAIPENIQFAFATAKIDPRSYELLNKIAMLLLAHPEVRQVRIEGHTDTIGTPAQNMLLSQQRAEAVRDYLISRGVPGEKLTTAGYGATRPLAPNTTEKNRAKNRRVEFIVVQ